MPKDCNPKLICFDDIIFNLQKFGGASTYWQQITSRIDLLIGGDSYHITGSAFNRLYRPTVKAKIFHSSHFRVASNKPVCNIVTIHDLTYEKGLVHGVGRLLNIFERKRCVKSADAIICISESTKRDLMEIYQREAQGKYVFVIHHGPTVESAKPPTVLDCSKSMNDCEKYFLFVGGRSGYKNFQAAVSGIKRINESCKEPINLVCTGSPLSVAERRMIENAGVARFVKSKPFLKPENLVDLYRNAIGLLYLSLYEGFGLPVLDAMALGCPVIGCNTSSIPEICGNAGMLVEPNDIDQLEFAMEKLLDEDNWLNMSRLGLEQAGKFSWERSAIAHLNVYKNFI